MKPLNSHAAELQSFWQGSILWNCPMAKYSTFKVGGPAEAVLVAENEEALVRVVRWLRENDITWQIIGKGSNILAPDEGLPGVVITLGGELARFSETNRTQDRVTIRAGAGATLARLVNHTTTSGLSGLEFAVGIPGSVGGALIMNAGAWGAEIGPLVESLTYLAANGERVTVKRQDLRFSYRRWDHPGQVVILGAELVLAVGIKEEIITRARGYAEERRRRQPQHAASAGSFFKNPEGTAAGKLIEEAGFKGYAIGGAMVSREHANFIVNTGSATARDILDLKEKIQASVYKKFGITLEPEVHILGSEAGGRRIE